MKKQILSALILCTGLGGAAAQNWECKFVDLGQGVEELSLLLVENDSTFGFVAKDTVNMDMMSRLEARIPGYDQVLDIDFGPTTYIYLIDGGTIVFRKCRSVSGSGTMAENPGEGDQGGGSGGGKP